MSDEALVLAPCWECGHPINVKREPDVRLFCDECRQVYLDRKKDDLSQYLQLKMKVMHERALRILEKQGALMYLYQEASEVILEYALNSVDKFASAHEMIAAMELIRNEIKIKIQHPIGKYKADIYIESLKSIVEIDGYMHEHSQVKDSKRDIDIRQTLGAEWETVRIPTKYIEQNVKQLIPAIRTIKKYKQQLRKDHSGILPDTYSIREKQHYKQLLSGITKYSHNYF